MFERLFRRKSNQSTQEPFRSQGEGLPLRRNYKSYEEYLRHQAEKLPKMLPQIERSDLEYETIIRERYREVADFSGKNVLCVCARLGGEVRGFKALGALAIGIDIQPGEHNAHVLYGDLHKLQFPDGVFDAVFTNSIDHVYELDLFAKEIGRVMRPDALFYAEIAEAPPTGYEVLDTSDIRPFIARLLLFFDIAWQRKITNITTYVHWSGSLLCMNRKAQRASSMPAKSSSSHETGPDGNHKGSS